MHQNVQSENVKLKNLILWSLDCDTIYMVANILEECISSSRVHGIITLKTTVLIFTGLTALNFKLSYLSLLHFLNFRMLVMNMVCHPV
jgi:hypothetical protein